MALTKITGQVINDSTGLVVGVTTVGGGLSATDGFFSGIVTAVGDASFSGNVSVGGTLTYEDVTNIDAVGLVTARNGIVVGSGITLSKDGDVFFTGIATGNGSGLTALNASNLASGTVPSARLGSGTASSSTFLAGDSTFKTVTGTTINTNADNRVITGSDTANTLNGESTLTHNAGVLSVNEPSLSTDGKIIVKGNDTNDHDIITAYSNSSTRGSFAIRNGTGIAPSFLVGTRGGSETLGLMSNGTERFRIGASGQFGIGGGTYGTSGQVLTSQGSSSAPQWATPAAWVYGTAADYDQWGSLTDVQFTGWPSTWQEIRVSFINISLNSGAKIQFFVSKSSSTAARITSGYQNTSGYYGSGTGVASVQNQGQFHGTESYAYQMNGYVSFYKFSSTVIRYEGQLVNKTDTYVFHTNGFVTCDPTTSMTHIFFRGTGASYDYGQFKLDYLGS